MKHRAAGSIRQKMNRVAFAATLAGLLVAGLVLAGIDLVRQLRASEVDLASQADILALSAQAPLSFQDAKAAGENLSTLRVKPQVAAAAVYDADGNLFASYRRAPLQRPLPARASAARGDIDVEYLRMVRPIVSAGEVLGTIYIEEAHGLLARALASVAVLAAVLAASLSVAYLVSNRLQRRVTGPILEISGVARQILRGETHAVRAEKRSDDEVGELVEAFNAMLGELGARADRLEESNRAKDRFLATLAHELRNPLAPIRTGLEILKRDPGNGPGAQRARATMERQVSHMVKLIDDLLDIARVNTGRFRIQPEPVSLRQVLEVALEACQPAMESNGLQLAVEHAEPDPVVVVDPVRLTQAVSNLVGNATKFTPEGGRISVRSTVDDERGLGIAVQDTGIGLATDELPRLFDLFSQVRTGQPYSKGGLGLGLFLVRSIAELHGGRVSASSAGHGQGACFEIWLPASVVRRRAPGPEAPAAAGAAPATPASAGRRVLVVDDNMDAAQTLAMMLQMLGHDAQTAFDGAAGLQAYEGFRPDVTVLDIGMPGMDGYEVARRIRARHGRAAFLVALTGWGSEQDRADARLAGFDAHLTKPVSIEDLQGVLASPATRAAPVAG